MKMKILVIVTLFIAVFICSGKNLSANGSFVENFNGNKLSDKWEVVAGNSNLEVNNGYFKILNNGSGNIPYLVTKNVVFPQNESYTFEINFAYPYSGYYGNGIFGSYKNEAGDLLDAFRIWHVAGRQIEVTFWHENFNIPWDTNNHVVKCVFNKDQLSSEYQGSLSLYIDDELKYFAPEYDRNFEYIELGARPFTPSVVNWTELLINRLTVKVDDV